MLSKSEKEIITKIIQFGKMMGDKNYTPGYSGNISMRANNNIAITVSGSANGYLKEEDLTLMDFEGNSLCEGKKPSSEKKLHIEFYKQREDINAIIHVHSPFLSSFASSGKDLTLPVMAENVFYFGEIPLAEYALPSSDKLVENTAKYFKTHDAVLMANHGFIIGGSSLEDAYLKLELAEQYAQVVLNTYVLGGPVALTKDQTEAILSLRN